MSNAVERLTPQQVTALHAAHGAELERFLVGILREPALAADCLQITFAKLVERGHESRPETRRAWLFRVAYQEAMLAKRKSATTDRVLRKAAWNVGQGWEEPDVRLFQAEAMERVQAALDQLPQEQRTVVRMRIYEDKTFAVIAAELKIPLGTALGRMRAALMKLKKELKP